VTRPVRHRAPQPTRIRAFEVLASCRDGCTQALLLAHGFTLPQLAELVRAGLATAQVERMLAAGRTMEVALVRIGRQALI
jgi:hypothetical protein